MAKFTFADGSVFEGTVEELAEYARLAGEMEAEQSKEIEGPVRVGDTIEIMKSETHLYTEGARYEVVGTVNVGGNRRPKVVNGHGNVTSVDLSKYRIVARKEETPQPAKPSPKVGDYVVFIEDYSLFIRAGKPYEVVDIDTDGDFIVIDEKGDENSFLPEKYRIITDARELAFAKAGRKMNEFKAGDIVRIDENAIAGHSVGDFGYADRIDSYDNTVAIVTGNGRDAFNWYKSRNATLIAPAEARVDANA